MMAQGNAGLVTLRRLAAASAVMAVLGAQTASAAGCLDRVESLASRHGVTSDPPSATADAGKPDIGKKPVTPRDLARSGGVIEPPPVRDNSVIEPPKTGSAMPTVPNIKPDAGPQPDKPAADQTKLQAALMAARSQAERGNEEGCQEALVRAETILKQEN